MPTTDLEENKIKQAQPEEGNNTSQNEREIRKNIFKNERVNFILGVILVIFSLYLTISFISFFFTGSIDQSKVENLSVGELSSIGNEIQNWTGAFGAYLSNLMINRWMGISAFIVSLWLYVVGRRFMKVAHTRMIRFTISCALSIIVLSLFFGFIFMHSYNNTFLYLGGYHGYYATLWLNAWIGPWGTALFIIALVIILLVHLSYKTIEYIRRVSSVSLTGKAIQAIKNRTDNPETDNENDNKETESNETQNTENIPSSENDIVNTLPEYPDDPTEEIPTLEDIQENILPIEEETKRVTIETGDPDFVIETAETEVLATQAPMEDYDPTKDLSHYKRPTFDLLDKRENSEVEITYPSKEELEKLSYRSKKELTGQVRLVRFPGSDLCACCGTHVTHTGEIGAVKILTVENFHEGIRLTMICGKRVMDYLNMVNDQNRQVSMKLSAKIGETAAAVARLQDENFRLKGQVNHMFDELCTVEAKNWEGAGSVLLFHEGLEADQVRRMADAVMQKCSGCCAVFSANGDGSYKYAIGEQNGDLRQFTKEMNAALNGRGGGKPFFVQGSVKASEDEIRQFFKQ